MASRKEYWEEYRAKKLQRWGFLEFEIKELASIPFKVPYMKRLITERKAVFEPFRVAKNRWWRFPWQSADIQLQFESVVAKLYADGKWRRKDSHTKRWRDDPWSMLRFKRQEAIAKGYDPGKGSPSQARRASHHKQFLSQDELDAQTEQRRQYRLTHRPQIRDYERNRRKFGAGEAGQLRQWIVEVEASIAKAADPAKKERLERQLKNMEKRLEEMG